MTEDRMTAFTAPAPRETKVVRRDGAFCGLLISGLVLLATQAPSYGEEASLGALSRAPRKCWAPPPGAAEAGLKVTIDMVLDSGGNLVGPPKIVEAPASALGEALAKSAQRAIVTCAPYRLPPNLANPTVKIRANFDSRPL
jgi:hypothetical protein